MHHLTRLRLTVTPVALLARGEKFDGCCDRNGDVGYRGMRTQLSNTTELSEWRQKTPDTSLQPNLTTWAPLCMHATLYCPCKCAMHSRVRMHASITPWAILMLISCFRDVWHRPFISSQHSSPSVVTYWTSSFDCFSAHMHGGHLRPVMATS